MFEFSETVQFIFTVGFAKKLMYFIFTEQFKEELSWQKKKNSIIRKRY